MRHNIVYYGEKIDNLFLKNKEEKLKIIIKKLIETFNLMQSMPIKDELVNNIVKKSFNIDLNTPSK